LDLFKNLAGSFTSPAISHPMAAKLRFLAEVVQKLKFPNNSIVQTFSQRFTNALLISKKDGKGAASPPSRFKRRRPEAS
jgi:hypothetical protein